MLEGVSGACCKAQGVSHPSLFWSGFLWRVQALYPVPRLLRSVALPAPLPDARLFRHRAVEVKLAYAEALTRGRGSGLARLHLVMRLPKPGWGVLNVTGPVVAWSFAAEVPEVLMPPLHAP